MKIVAALVAMAMVALTSAAHADDHRPLRIGSEGAYPPFNSLDANGRLQGFDIDVANALCAQMNRTCEFVQEDWDSIIPALIANKYDMIAAAMSITDERRKWVAFSKPYARSAISFATRRIANIRDITPAAMKGRVIGAQANTVSDRYLTAVYEPAGAIIRRYQTQQEAQLELSSGRIDVIAAGKLFLYDWLTTKQGGCCVFAGDATTDGKYTGEGIAIAVRNDDKDLLNKLNAAMDAIVANGTFKKINDKYYPFSVY
ncbi:transporter substrate-binding domain-containing protein [Flaviflagellibacter deserti]|uniref:Transporter substrate-binding domain-containing protein n=1 Tax=Flaviflagellibacter deserti TaxID=2267266 RepID=A0ABV9Z139_9HYPH